MADITNAEAIAFVNDFRATMEGLRAMHERLQAAKLNWFNGINVMIPNDASILEDGRTDGASVLKGTDINSTLTIAANVLTVLDAAGVDAQIEKLCVRPPQL